jgi:hypothetical protein
MGKRPLSVSAGLIFVLLNALIWLVLGEIIALQAHPALPVSRTIQTVMVVLSFGAAAILVGLFVFLWRHNRITWFLTVGFLALTSILTIFDDFGWADLIVLVINVIPIVLLIKDRAWYLGKKSEAPG